MRIAVLLLLIDREEISWQCIKTNTAQAGMPFDWFITDNGSQSDALARKIEAEVGNLAYLHEAGTNYGVAHGFNRMIRMAMEQDYDAVVLCGNDILNGHNWLRKMADLAQSIPDTGIVALNWGCGANPITRRRINDVVVDEAYGVYGTMLIPRNVVESVGYLCTDYWPYGLEDSDYNIRTRHAGFVNYYVADHVSRHLGEDVGARSDYRKMKDRSLSENLARYNSNVANYSADNYYLPYQEDPYFM